MTSSIVEIPKRKTLEEKCLERWAEEGYEPVQRLGSGNTRTTWALAYGHASGEGKGLVVGKAPKEDLAHSPSLQTRVNFANGEDRNRNEAQIASTLDHPSIVKVMNSYVVDGQLATIEEYVKGQDLEAFIKSHGPVTDPDKFKDIMGKVVDGLAYLHKDYGKPRLLHRDIKPSNILIGTDVVKITDLQNCTPIHEVDEIALPTRGGTAYTHPGLLNALATGTNAGASEQTDIYALGATMYYVLTGEDAFDYNVELNPNGEREVLIGDESVRINLTSNGRRVRNITPEEHERELNKKLKSVPKRFRNLLRNCLSLRDKKKHYDIYSVKDDLDKADDTVLEKIRKTARKFAMPVTVSTIVGGLLGFGIHQGIVDAGKEPKPTLAEILSREDYSEFSLEAADEFTKEDLIWQTYPEMQDAIRKYSVPLDEEREKAKGSIDFIASRSQMWGIDPKLGRAFVYGCLYHEDKKLQESYGDTRLDLTYTPVGFFNRFMSVGGLDRVVARTEELDNNVKITSSLNYLKLCLGPDKNVADVLADYFCSRDEIHAAKIISKSDNYFVRVDRKMGASGESSVGGTMYSGYSQYLPHEKRQIIEEVLAFYQLMDEEGNFDPTRLPQKPTRRVVSNIGSMSYSPN